MDDFLERFRELRRRVLVLDLPIEPNWISALSVIVSVGVWLNPILAIFSALVLDALDGMAARGRHGESREGHLTDWACDRFSEFIIFGHYAATMPALAALPVLNTLTAIETARGGKIPVLPLRQLLLLYLLVF